MQIIAGALGGRHLRTLGGGSTRPAMGRTREALFSMLEARGMDWEGKRVLDLFAGCGSLGLEALSRGAASATFVDNSSAAAACIARNVRDFNLEARSRIIEKDVSGWLNRSSLCPYDMVFIDPPYRRNYVMPCLRTLISRKWLNIGAMISAEIEKAAKCDTPPELELVGERLFGQTQVLIWKESADYSEVKNEDCPISRDI